MKRNLLKAALSLFSLLILQTISFAQAPKFRVLALYSTNVESDHVDFAMQAMKFYSRFAVEKGFALDTTSHWEDLNDEKLKNYQVVVWLNEFPHNQAQRSAFEKFMANGGAWL